MSGPPGFGDVFVKRVSNNPDGRPTEYDSKFVNIVKGMCQLGATDKEVADALGVTVMTLYRWQIRHREFCDALVLGKEACDERIGRSLYHRASGYSYDSLKIVADAKSGSLMEIPYVEHVPPDPTSMIFWLKNRRRDLWRDKQDVEHAGKVTLESLIGESYDGKKEES